MNIALFSDTYLPDINGVATSTHILKKELKKTWTSCFNCYNLFTS